MNLRQRQYNKDRDNAIIELVKTGSLEEWYKVAKKYNMMSPKNEMILKAGLYKAAQACVNIPEEIKEKAAEECRALGMDPYTFGGKEEKDGTN